MLLQGSIHPQILLPVMVIKSLRFFGIFFFFLHFWYYISFIIFVHADMYAEYSNNIKSWLLWLSYYLRSGILLANL